MKVDEAEVKQLVRLLVYEGLVSTRLRELFICSVPPEVVAEAVSRPTVASDADQLRFDILGLAEYDQRANSTYLLEYLANIREYIANRYLGKPSELLGLIGRLVDGFPSKEAPSLDSDWVARASGASVASGVISALSVAELVAVFLLTWQLLQTPFALFPIGLALLAPSFMLRTQQSTELSLRLLVRFETPLVVLAWLLQSLHIVALVFVVFVLVNAESGLAAVALVFVVATVYPATSTFLVLPLLTARLLGTLYCVLRHPIASLSSVPENWIRIALLTDVALRPTPLPGLEQPGRVPTSVYRTYNTRARLSDRWTRLRDPQNSQVERVVENAFSVLFCLVAHIGLTISTWGARTIAKMAVVYWAPVALAGSLVRLTPKQAFFHLKHSRFAVVLAAAASLVVANKFVGLGGTEPGLGVNISVVALSTIYLAEFWYVNQMHARQQFRFVSGRRILLLWVSGAVKGVLAALVVYQVLASLLAVSPQAPWKVLFP